MLTIRREQMAVFRGPALRTFEDHVIVHLDKCFPGQTKALGEPNVRETIQYGIRRAASYGIVAERDVCKYIDLMIVFGRDFDKDPRQPWAQSVLNDRRLKDPSTKVGRLYKELRKHHVREGGAERGGR